MEPVVLPIVLIAPQWYGLSDMEKFRAKEFASRGYLAFAIDIYGNGVTPTTREEAGAASTALRSDPAKLFAHLDTIVAAVGNLHSLIDSAPVTDPKSIVATGYCLGGLVVYEMARRNLPGVLAVSGFHPSFGILTDPPLGNITAYVMAHHGQLDSAKDQGLLDFEAKMTQGGATWSTSKYSNMPHGWTDPRGDSYDALQAELPHDATRALFARILATHGTTPYNPAL
eukprot:gb/GEZN01007094.1/.p1 GENE.gb/GEZN01007094.1/~~gb/GEZN01007094.1/.p1  ORF type:complete len:227 (+),score=42.41 gb/GEZN01007094.1/:385-1065(+)